MASLYEEFDRNSIDAINAGVRNTHLTARARKDASKRWSITERAVEFIFGADPAGLRLCKIAAIGFSPVTAWDDLSNADAERMICGMAMTGLIEFESLTIGTDDDEKEAETFMDDDRHFAGMAACAAFIVDFLQGDIDRALANCCYSARMEFIDGEWRAVFEYYRATDSDEWYAVLEGTAPWFREGF